MQRRHALVVLGLLALLMPFAVGESSTAKDSYLTYVGTYTGPASKGI